MVSTICKGCGIDLEAEGEDELVTIVQAHIAEAHARGHTPTREQVLAVIRKRGAGDRAHGPAGAGLGGLTKN